MQLQLPAGATQYAAIQNPTVEKNLTSDKIELLCFYRGEYESIQEGHSEGAYLCQAPDSAIRLYGNLASHPLYVWREF